MAARRAGLPLTEIDEFDLAFAACKAIRFAVEQAERHSGDYNLNDILAANHLATDALRKAGQL